MVSVSLSVCCVFFVLGAVMAEDPKVDIATRYIEAITKCEKEGCVDGDITQAQNNPCCYKCIMRELEMLNEDGTPKIRRNMPDYDKITACCSKVKKDTGDCSAYLEYRNCFSQISAE